MPMRVVSLASSRGSGSRRRSTSVLLPSDSTLDSADSSSLPTYFLVMICCRDHTASDEVIVVPSANVAPLRRLKR